MKTAEQQLQRMEDLVRKMANRRVGLDMMQNIEDHLEAQAIVAELPEPVDADLVTARKLASGAVFYGQCNSANGGRDWKDFAHGECDAGDVVSDIVQALRRAREEGAK